MMCVMSKYKESLCFYIKIIEQFVIAGIGHRYITICTIIPWYPRYSIIVYTLNTPFELIEFSISNSTYDVSFYIFFILLYLKNTLFLGFIDNLTKIRI